MADHSLSHAARWRIAAATVALSILWLVMLTVGTGDADEDILEKVYVGGHPLLVELARFFTMLGMSIPGIIISVSGIVLLAVLRSKHEALAATLVIAAGRLLVEAQKFAVHRLRPQIEAHLVPVSSASFPSGHAGNSMIVGLTFAILFFGQSRWRWPAVVAAFVLSLCIGSSRVMLGVHYPSDVIGGWSFGLLWVLLALPYAERIARVKPSRAQPVA